MIFMSKLVPQILIFPEGPWAKMIFQNAGNVTLPIATAMIGLNYLVVSVLIGAPYAVDDTLSLE